MQSFQADSAALPQGTGYQGTWYHLVLADIADEVVGTLARLFVYVGTLALLAILGLAALSQLPSLGDDEPELRSASAIKDGCDPANQVNFLTRSARYAVSRRPAGDSGGEAGQTTRGCPPDWLRGAGVLQLRGSL